VAARAVEAVREGAKLPAVADGVEGRRLGEVAEGVDEVPVLGADGEASTRRVLGERPQGELGKAPVQPFEVEE